MKIIIKWILNLTAILLLLIAYQFYRQSSEPLAFVWEPEELDRLLTNSGAKNFAVSENNVVSMTIEQGVAPIDGLQGTVALFPVASLEFLVVFP